MVIQDFSFFENKYLSRKILRGRYSFALHTGSHYAKFS